MKTLKTELIDCFDKLDSNLHFAFMEVQQECRKGTIHSLRVSLKRIRAFFQLLDEIDLHFAGDMAVKQLSPVFREAGKLRDLQIEHALLFSHEEKLLLDHATSDQLLIRIQEQQEIFLEFQRGFSVADLRECSQHARSHLLHTPLRTLRKGLRNYFRVSLRDLGLLSREGLSSKKSLHDLRKKVKKVHYNLIVADQAIAKYSIPPELLHSLENLQNQLGKWHDYRITLDELKSLKAVPAALRRALQQEESLCLQDLRSTLVLQLPTLTECLLQEADNLIAPKPKTCSS